MQKISCEIQEEICPSGCQLFVKAQRANPVQSFIAHERTIMSLNEIEAQGS